MKDFLSAVEASRLRDREDQVNDLATIRASIRRASSDLKPDPVQTRKHLTDDEQRSVTRLLGLGVTSKALAERYGCSERNIYRIRKQAGIKRGSEQ